MANKFWPATSLTEGDAALTAIPAAEVSDGDAAFVVRDGIFSFYRMNVSSEAAHNPPDVVAPDDVGGDNFRWIKIGAIGDEPLFQPTDIDGCYCWIDFADEDSLTIVDDGGTDKISFVNEKSGAEVVTCHDPWGETVSNRPLYIADGINSLGCVGWPDADQQFRLYLGPPAEDTPLTNTGFTLFCVFKPSYGSRRPIMKFEQCGGSHDTAIGLHSHNEEGVGYEVFAESNTATNVTESGISANGGVLLFSAHGDVGVGYSTFVGGESISQEATASYSMNNYAYLLMVGSGMPADGNSRNLLIGEVLVFNSALDEEDRQKVEGYLAHKWGIAASLPEAHPWKSTPPF